jgi:hypothetical protein
MLRRHIICTCPQTGMHVQHLLPEVLDETKDSHSPMICQACMRMHFIHNTTGKCSAKQRSKAALNRMTGEESRKLVAGDRVFWQSDVKNQGTVKGTSWSSVTIDWDDGDLTSISHNDMAQVHRASP